jgi:EthD domain-containing protein
MVEVELLVFTLVRGPATEPDVGEAVRAHRAALRRELRAGSGEAVAYEVVGDPGDHWIDGGVDVVTGAVGDTLAAAVASIARARAQVPSSDAVSFRAFATERNEVRTPPVDGLHTFSSGGMAEGFDRLGWQARWREHARLLEATPEFSRFLTGYVQYHGVDPARARALGVDDTHGIAQMTYRSAEERARALSHREYVEVLRPDEDEFVSRTRGMRVFVSRAEGA